MADCWLSARMCSHTWFADSDLFEQQLRATAAFRKVPEGPVRHGLYACRAPAGRHRRIRGGRRSGAHRHRCIPAQGEPLPRDLADLREAQNRIVGSPESGTRYTVVNTETDCIVTSLNILVDYAPRSTKPLAGLLA